MEISKAVLFHLSRKPMSTSGEAHSTSTQLWWQKREGGREEEGMERGKKGRKGWIEWRKQGKGVRERGEGVERGEGGSEGEREGGSEGERGGRERGREGREGEREGELLLCTLWRQQSAEQCSRPCLCSSPPG